MELYQISCDKRNRNWFDRIFLIYFQILQAWVRTSDSEPRILRVHVRILRKEVGMSNHVSWILRV